MQIKKPNFVRKMSIVLKKWTRRIVLPGFEGLTLYDVALFFFKGIKNGAITTRASSVAFNFFLALFPAIIFVFSLIPYIPIDNFAGVVLEIIADVFPQNAYDTAKSTLSQIMNHQKGGVLTFAIILAIFFSTNGLAGIITSFNKTYHSIETRSALKQRAVSAVLVLVISMIFILSIILIVLGKSAFFYLLENQYLKSSMTMHLIRYFRWIAVVFMFLFGISILYYYAPAKKQRFRFISAGSILATFLVMIVSIIFKFWFNHFVKFNVLFGSIGSLMVILLWIYFIAIILLIGFELNASIQNANIQKQLQTEDSQA